MIARLGLAALGAATLVLAGSAYVSAQPGGGGLADPAEFAKIADRGARSVALFNEMGKVLTHPRCVNCHPRTDTPLQGEKGQLHSPVVFRGKDGHGVPGLECSTCHGPANVNFANGTGSIPGDPRWHLAPASMAWEGKTLRQICEQIKDRSRNGGKSLAQLVAHNGTDHLVGYGWNPGKGRQPAPGTQARFGALTQAWVDSGAKCPS